MQVISMILKFGIKCFQLNTLGRIIVIVKFVWSLEAESVWQHINCLFILKYYNFRSKMLEEIEILISSLVVQERDGHPFE